MRNPVQAIALILQTLIWSLSLDLSLLMAAGLVTSSLVAWGLNFVSLPGNWVAIGLLAIYVWWGPDVGRLAIGIPPLVMAFLLGVGGEVIELMAAAMGAKRAGASRRSTIYALVGSFAGAIMGAIVGLPVPAIGSILAAILFGGLGAAMGAMYGEWTDGKPWRDSWTVGHAAFWGRTFGMLGKVAAGALILIVMAAALVL